MSIYMSIHISNVMGKMSDYTSAGWLALPPTVGNTAGRYG